MKMPDKISEELFAPCGMNCMVCYKHVQVRKSGKPCGGCLRSDEGKPEHCRKCKIIGCAKEKGYTYCFACEEFPCKLVKNMERSYVKRYGVSLVENSNYVKAYGLEAFMEYDRQRWLCEKCGGAFSLHDGICSDCGLGKK